MWLQVFVDKQQLTIPLSASQAQWRSQCAPQLMNALLKDSGLRKAYKDLRPPMSDTSSLAWKSETKRNPILFSSLSYLAVPGYILKQLHPF